MQITEATRLALKFSKALDTDDHAGDTETWPAFTELLELYNKDAAFHARNKAIDECYAAWENCRGDDSFWDKLRNK
jgi:hypothetical protein